MLLGTIKWVSTKTLPTQSTLHLLIFSGEIIWEFIITKGNGEWFDAPFTMFRACSSFIFFGPLRILKGKICVNLTAPQEVPEDDHRPAGVRGNHQCAVCVVNNHCELQNLAYDVGLLYVRFPYLYPKKRLDASHEDFHHRPEPVRALHPVRPRVPRGGRSACLGHRRTAASIARSSPT